MQRIAPVRIVGFLFFAYALTGCKKEAAPVTNPVDSVAVTSVLTPVTTTVSSQVDGYYVALPSNYNQTPNKYPLLIFIAGGGQFGNGSYDLPLLLKDGPAELVDEKRFPGSFQVNGKTFSFIIFTPQFKQTPDARDVSDCIAFAKSKYRVDESRIYLSGISIGSIAACNLATEVPAQIAALVAMAGVPLDYPSNDKCKKIATSNLPIWVFHSEDDPVIGIANAKGFIAKINSFNPAVAPKLTVWPNGGHDAWTKALEPSYKEGGLNMYEWMLQYHR